MVHDYSIKEFMIRFPINRNHDSKHPEWWFLITGILALSTGSVALKIRTGGSKGAGILIKFLTYYYFELLFNSSNAITYLTLLPTTTNLPSST